MGCTSSSVVADLAEENRTKKHRSVSLLVQRSDVFLGRGKPFKEGAMSDFNFLGKLGQGGFATVHKARSSQLGDSTVAVKVLDLKREFAEEWSPKQVSEHRVYRLKKEVAMLTRVTGKANVVEFYGSFREGCLSFIVMEMCDRSLREGFSRLPAITEATVGRILREMLNGLASVHRVGIVHRDVKPDNFLCVGPEDTVKLCDFGFASALPRHGGLTGRCGTPPFMSPEMLNDKNYDHKTDVWSFGVIVYSLFFGKLPYEPSEQTVAAMKESIRSGIPVPSFSPSASIPSAQQVSDGAMELVLHLLDRDPDHRIHAESAHRYKFFKSPGKTNLEPTFESAKTRGSFRKNARNDPSRKSKVDLRLETLQREYEESRDVQEPDFHDIMIHAPITKADDEDCSTYVGSEITQGLHNSPVSTVMSFEASALAQAKCADCSPWSSACAP